MNVVPEASSSALRFSDASDLIVETPVEQIADIIMHSLDDIDAFLVRRAMINNHHKPARRLLRNRESQRNEDTLLHPYSALIQRLGSAVQDLTARLLVELEVTSSHPEFRQLLEANE